MIDIKGIAKEDPEELFEGMPQNPSSSTVGRHITEYLDQHDVKYEKWRIGN